MLILRWKLDLQMFAEDTGVEAAPAAEVQTESTQVEASETGAETSVAAEPEKQNNFEKAFAKRLAEAQSKWESEHAEKYKDYDDLKKAAEFFQRRHGFNDFMSLKEEIELAELQDRAEKEQVSPQIIKRIDELEAKAAKADALERQQEEEKRVSAYWSTLNEFVKEKGIEADKLNQFMIENEMTYNPNAPEKSFMLAYKAMKADELEEKLASAEKEGMKKLLQAKGSIPTVPGSNANGQVSSPAPKTFAEARQRAMQRMTGEG